MSQARLTVHQLVDILETFFERDDVIENVQTSYGLSINYKRDDTEFRFAMSQDEVKPREE